ncbi:hypothetical protein BC629DRAFT_1439877 [Irpex lacteus]|nr:hypothetical protein BC629DRAFT_1439877 [Irpex lacteus]
MPSLTLATLETQFNLLSIYSVLFEALNAFFGVYIVLFVLALWSIHRRQGVAYKRLRIATVSLFVVLAVHYISRAIVTSRSRRMVMASDEETKVTVPLQIVDGITLALAAFIFDSTLAWRFYVIYGRVRWALLIPVIAVIIDATLGLIASGMDFSLYSTPQLYHAKLDSISFMIEAAWGWCMFVTNTLMTGGIIGKILYVSRMTKGNNSVLPYGVLLEAIIESASVTWTSSDFEIEEVTDSQAELNIGYVSICTLPVVFGISHCLITARLGFFNDGLKSRSSSSSGTEPTDGPYTHRHFRARAIEVAMVSGTSIQDPTSFAEKDEVSDLDARESTLDNRLLLQLHVTSLFNLLASVQHGDLVELQIESMASVAFGFQYRGFDLAYQHHSPDLHALAEAVAHALLQTTGVCDG